MLKYKSGYAYYTTEAVEVPVDFACPDFPLAVVSDTWMWCRQGRLVIRARYAWDGASFVLFRWFGTPTTWLLPSLVHDALYGALRDGQLGRQYRDAIDQLFYRHLRARGVSWLLAKVAYYCVRIGGNFAVRKTNPVREAV